MNTFTFSKIFSLISLCLYLTACGSSGSDSTGGGNSSTEQPAIWDDGNNSSNALIWDDGSSANNMKWAD